MKEKITVIDSVMGSGKTSWAIEYMNSHYDENTLYITPYLGETERIKEHTKKEIKCPRNFGDGKLENFLELLRSQEDIASTHALFLKLTEECKEAIREGHYTLFLDETIAAVEPYNVKYKDDIDYLLKKGSIAIDENGFIQWVDDDLDTRYNPIKILAQNHSLFFVNQKLLMWRYPPEIFSLFDKVYILTYLFDASILKYYFDMHGVSYETKSVRKAGESFSLCDYYMPDTEEFAKKIHIYNKSDLNENFPQKITGLSASWFRNKANGDKIKKLQKNIYNFFTNKEPARGEKIMWTTFKESQKKLSGKGYTKGFVSCNCRATNDFSGTDHLAYCLNVYPHVGVSQFFAQHGLVMDSDKYALSEMLQWIWRSSIRDGKEIWIYIPSKRMRKLLQDWLKGKIE